MFKAIQDTDVPDSAVATRSSSLQQPSPTHRHEKTCREGSSTWTSSVTTSGKIFLTSNDASRQGISEVGQALTTFNFKTNPPFEGAATLEGHRSSSGVGTSGSMRSGRLSKTSAGSCHVEIGCSKIAHQEVDVSRGQDAEHLDQGCGDVQIAVDSSKSSWFNILLN